MHKSILVITALAWLSGCAVGPDYQPVEPDAPARFHAATQQQADPAPLGVDEQRFWRGFQDPMLAGLIRQTLDANRERQGALARYQRAEALVLGTSSVLA